MTHWSQIPFVSVSKQLMPYACRMVGRRLLGSFFAIAIIIAAPRSSAASVTTQMVANNLPYLVDIQHPGDGSGRLFLVLQTGRIMVYDGTQVLATPFLDISNLVSFGGEQGLLGLAFHPHYSNNGFFFVNYTDTSGNTVIARYVVSAAADVADPDSATTLLTVTQPYSNHNGGQIRFGPDGFLYVALGDGGSGGDPQNYAQNLQSLLGKLLRLDVDSASPYGIPVNNPFVTDASARHEIWTWGLRNPWRFSFDRQTGDLFIADVGQNNWEEINFQPAGVPGGRNYGWRRMEGLHCFNPTSSCNDASLMLPILEYPHSLGCSVTGGFRYRGSTLSDYIGTYFFGDYCTGRIWGATPNIDGIWTATQIVETGLSISTFGEDSNGEIYLANYGANGGLYRLVPSTALPLLTVVRGGTGTGTVTSTPAGINCGSICGVRYSVGTPVTLTAVADSGSSFNGFGGDADCSDASVTMISMRNCTAI